MKKPALLQVLLLLALTGCKSSSVDKKKDGILYKETVVINDIPRASLTFFDVSDSRCPEGAQCIWAGNAVVDLALTGVTTEGGITNHVTMCLGACNQKFKSADTLDYEFTGQRYRFILSAINPYPKSGVIGSKEKYTISLDIQKK